MSDIFPEGVGERRNLAVRKLPSFVQVTLLVLDEAERADEDGRGPEHSLKKIAFIVPSGVGRKRSAVVHDTGLEDCTWRVLMLTSWEMPFYSTKKGSPNFDGQKVRLIEIPVAARKEGGIFNGGDVGIFARQKSGSKHVKRTESIIEENHGVAIRPYIEGLLQTKGGLERRVKDLIGQFVRLNAPEGDGFEVRLAKKFGLVCAGGQLAAELEVAPFSEESAIEACSELYRRALATMKPVRSIMSPESWATAILKAATAERFPRVEERETFPTSIKDPWGVQRKIEGKYVIAIRREKLVEIAGRQVSHEMLSSIASAMIPGSSGKLSRQINITGWPDGGRCRFYCFMKRELKRLASQQ